MSVILTPKQIFQDFVIKSEIKTEMIETTEENGIIREDFYIYGKKSEDGQTKIYSVSYRKKDDSKKNAIIVIGKLSRGIDKGLLKVLAEKGYYAVSIDIAGANEKRKYYTQYPDSLKYANMASSMVNSIELIGSVYDTCWYVWDCNVRYLIHYLKKREDIEKIGMIGISGGAVPVWHAIGTDNGISCAVICLNAGWKGYRGTYKIENKPEPNFTDGQLKFFAGVEPQSYAMHVDCPLYFIGATNSDSYECDRVYDTISAINNRVFSSVNYSVGSRNDVSYESFLGAYKFFDEAFHKVGNKKPNLPDSIEVEVSDEKDDKYTFKIEAQSSGLKRITLYTAENVVKPSLRCWKKHNDVILEKEDKYRIEVKKNEIDGNFSYFAQAEYQDSYSISSKIYYFNEGKEKIFSKQKLIFSSGLKNCESIFYPSKEDIKGTKGVNVLPSPKVELKEGPYNMFGAYSQGGLLSFILSEKGGRPYEDSILMFDVWATDGGILSVKLIENYYGERVDYIYNCEVNGVKSWQNVKINRNELKTIDGKQLKSYEKIEAIEIEVNGEDVFDYAVNNVLWI